MSELDSQMNMVMAPAVRMQKIAKRAKELGLKLSDIKNMTEKEIQDKFGDIDKE